MDDSANGGASCSSSKPIFRRRSRRSQRQLSPSSSLLSVLAAVVADSSPANAAPPPLHLSFLYPSLDSPSTSNHLEASKTHPSNRTRPARIGRTFPDKFVRGEDGRWRKADLFTFNGYALRGEIAKGSSSTAIPTMNNDVADGSALPTSVPGASLPMPTCNDGSEWENCLPNGWKRPERTDRTGLILIISLVLAFFICFFIIFCLLWRKSKRRVRDVERRHRRRRKKKEHEEQDEEEIRSILEKNMKTKKKIWARATARWKENAHYTAWRRRGKKTNLNVSNPALLSTTTPSSLTHSRRTSRLPSRSPSPNRSRSPSPPPIPPSSPPPPPPSDSDPSPSTHPPSALPPAYQHRRRLQNWQSTPQVGASADSASQAHVTQNVLEHIEDNGQSPFLVSGHVATDDKAFLRQLTDQASSPPTEQQESGATHQQASVPIWRDEDISDFAHEDSDSVHHGDTYGLFPPPPMLPSSSEKGKMAMAYFDYDFEEGPSDVSGSMVRDDQMVGEPSEPPFEEGEPFPIASAPPLNHEDELEYLDESDHELEGVVPSAPPEPVAEDDTRRDSSLQELGLDFGSRASLSQDLPVYRP